MSKRLIGLHRPAGVSRQAEDFYATDGTAAIPPLMKLLGWENGGKLILENSCGQGHLAVPLMCYGHTVIATDLIDRGFGIGGVDFLQENPFLDNLPYDGIIMNPPFKQAQDFVEKSISIAPVVCAFLRLTFLESKKRRPFFQKHPPEYVAVFSERVRCAKDGDFKNIGQAVVAYAWFVFKQNPTGITQVVWI